MTNDEPKTTAVYDSRGWGGVGGGRRGSHEKEAKKKILQNVCFIRIYTLIVLCLYLRFLNIQLGYDVFM